MMKAAVFTQVLCLFLFEVFTPNQICRLLALLAELHISSQYKSSRFQQFWSVFDSSNGG